jgi:hypothetical protein
MSNNVVRLGTEEISTTAGSNVADALDQASRRQVESWLSALVQADHLSLLVGNGLSTAVGGVLGEWPPQMGAHLPTSQDCAEIQRHAEESAKRMGRQANLEDEIRSALSLAEGYDVLGQATSRDAVLAAVDDAMLHLITGVLTFERGVKTAIGDADAKAIQAQSLLQRFLVPFANRAVGRDRLSLFTTNYDRLLEFAADLLGLRLLDRFVGSLEPIFSASRLDIDMHYSPPGIRGEPRYLEGVVRLAKLHGSVDWRASGRSIVKAPLAFGAQGADPQLPKKPSESVVIYPNPAKDVETLAYPYAEMFRDFAAAISRPNAVLVTYGYGFGDSHINRVIGDMLRLPSTHLVVVSYSPLPGLDTFKGSGVYPYGQTTELIGAGVAALDNFVTFLPSLASAELLERQLKHAEMTARLRSATGPGLSDSGVPTS